jgi:hypothetical protein
MLLFGEYEVYSPTPANVRPRTAEVIEDSLVGATRVFQGVGKYRQPTRV